MSLRVLAPVALIGITIAAVPPAATPRLPGHPLLVSRPGLRVYGPPRRASMACPTVLPLPADALATVKHAVEVAMPPFEAQLKLDGHDPVVKVAPASRSGFDDRAGGCGHTTWQRSIVAFVFLPQIKHSASLAQHTFAVARVAQGWVLWAWIQ
jgi:hypothetical protein